MRVISFFKDDIKGVLSPMLTKLATTLTLVSDNPSNPTFNHYLFETISASIKYVPLRALPIAVF